MSELNKRIHVPISADHEAWLEKQSAKFDRPKAYVVRALIEDAIRCDTESEAAE